MLNVIWCGIFCLPVCYPTNINFNTDRIVTLPVIYKCDALSLILRAKHMLTAFK